MADINDTIANNLGLVYKQLHRFKLADNPDAISIAYEALYKAIKTFDGTSGTKLSTYATCVIANALRRHLRTCNKKRQLHVMSYDALLSDDTDSNSFIDLFAGPNNTEELALKRELSSNITTAISIVYSNLANENYKAIFKCWYDSEFTMSQQGIAQSTGLSQAYVSRVLSVVKYKLRLELEDYL